RNRDLPAVRVREANFVAERVPRIADVFAESTRHTHDDRRREPIRRAPPHRARVIQLLRGRIGVFAKLNFRDGHESRDRHADRTADDAFFGQTRVEHALVAELLLQSFGDEMDAAFATNVFAEDEDFRIHLELATQRATYRLGE